MIYNSLKLSSIAVLNRLWIKSCFKRQEAKGNSGKGYRFFSYVLIVDNSFRIAIVLFVLGCATLNPTY
jgi:hypothetical protein